MNDGVPTSAWAAVYYVADSSASLMDLSGAATFATLLPPDWYFIGGAASTFTPDAIRLFAGGDTVTENVVMAGVALAALALWRPR